jgi:hypothetical protein
MPDFADPPMPRPRRSSAFALGTAVWVSCVGAAWGVSDGTFPVARWLDAAAAPARVASRVSLPMRREVAAVALPEPRPLPPPVTAEPEPPASPEPEPPALPEPAPVPVALPAPPPADSPALPPPAAPVAMKAEPAFDPLPPLPEPHRQTLPRARADAPAPAPPPAGGASYAGTSCEAAAAAYHDEIQVGKDRGPADLGAADYARVLDNGAWFAACSVPVQSAIDVCVAVQNGRARGVTVRTIPRSLGAEGCIARAASRLAFPSHPRLDVARTHFTGE